jgi:thiamine kinase-like enzyme
MSGSEFDFKIKVSSTGVQQTQKELENLTKAVNKQNKGTVSQATKANRDTTQQLKLQSKYNDPKVLRSRNRELTQQNKLLKEQVLTMEKGLLEMGPLNERIKALEKSLEEAVKQRDEYYQHSLRIYEDAERLRKELETAYSASTQGAPPPSAPTPSVSSAPAPLPEPPSFEESFESLESSLEDLDK